MAIGLPVFRDARELRLDHRLTQPFRTPGAASDPAPVHSGEVRGS